MIRLLKGIELAALNTEDTRFDWCYLFTANRMRRTNMIIDVSQRQVACTGQYRRMKIHILQGHQDWEIVQGNRRSESARLAR